MTFPATLKPSIKDVTRKLADMFPKFLETTIDPELKNPRPNLLILLNGAEISVLNGLKTKIQDGDKLVFVPISHGG